MLRVDHSMSRSRTWPFVASTETSSKVRTLAFEMEGRGGWSRALLLAQVVFHLLCSFRRGASEW